MAEQRYEWIEVMRGFAAVWVLLGHAANRVSYFVAPIPGAMLGNGYLGVDFFFVLSGFVIALSSERIIARGGGLRDYAWSRATRIYVPYLPVGIGVLLLYTMFPGASEGGRNVSLLTSLTLLPDTLPPALSVAWTLVHEMLFYALFTVVFVSKRLLLGALSVWVLLILGFVGTDLARLASYFLSPMNLCFVLGVCLYYIVRKFGAPAGPSVAAIVVGALFVVSQALRAEPNRVLITLGFAGLIYASCSGFAVKHRPGRALVLIGAASYAIYLVHSPVIAATVRILKTDSPWLAMGALSTVALAAGLAYHVIYEKRALAFVRGWAPKRSGLQVTQAPPTDPT